MTAEAYHEHPLRHGKCAAQFGVVIELHEGVAGPQRSKATYLYPSWYTPTPYSLDGGMTMHRSMLRKFLRDHYLKPNPRSIPEPTKDRGLTSPQPPHA
jgi:hypothetical protein